MGEVFAIAVDEIINSKMLNDLFNILSEERKEKTKKFKFEIDAKQSICISINKVYGIL